ncbi:MAG: right-handed parallel beta-helix repeat-containing protein, partial [Thermomicrobiales bacterium]|nr:right-handed parallel beta-helix repeat-containing protein [Thermomicrobiales bacterium]
MTARLNRATSRIIVVAAILLIVGIPWPMPVSAATEAPDLVVCATCEVTTLQDALAQAPDGARIEVRGGSYAAPLVIDRDVELIGIDRPVIDGGGEGTIIHATGAAVTISGFIIRGTGTTLDHEDSGILVEKGHATIVDNIIEDSLFGIYLKESPGSILRDNIVRSKPLPIALRGDGVKVWYSDDMVIEGNQADDGRDVILWYSNRGIVRNNEFNGGRYGLHLMFS